MLKSFNPPYADDGWYTRWFARSTTVDYVSSVCCNIGPAILLPSDTCMCTMQLHMAPGRLGKYDERKMIYPDAPFFSHGGRNFLKSLTRATRKRLQLTLRLIDVSNEDYWDSCRVRAPDAGRMMWAMGKLQWQSKKLLKLLEAVAVQVSTTPCIRCMHSYFPFLPLQDLLFISLRYMNFLPP
jgi:hypothetical protein